MDRRHFLASVPAAIIAARGTAFGQSDPLAALLDEIRADTDLVEDGWLFREPSVSRGVGRGPPSRRKLTTTAIDLIIAFEGVKQ